MDPRWPAVVVNKPDSDGGLGRVAGVPTAGGGESGGQVKRGTSNDAVRSVLPYKGKDWLLISAAAQGGGLWWQQFQQATRQAERDYKDTAEAMAKAVPTPAGTELADSATSRCQWTIADHLPRAPLDLNWNQGMIAL